MTEIVYDFLPDKAAGYIPGVPMRALTQADLDRMPAWALASIEAAPFFLRVDVQKRSKRKKTGAEETTETSAPDPAEADPAPVEIDPMGD